MKKEENKIVNRNSFSDRNFHRSLGSQISRIVVTEPRENKRREAAGRTGVRNVSLFFSFPHRRNTCVRDNPGWLVHAFEEV